MNTPAVDFAAEFKKLGDRASFHYADDRGKEWKLADQAHGEALAIFDAHPELHEQMRLDAKGFLWSLERDRPVATLATPGASSGR